MREELQDKLITALMPCLQEGRVADAKMQIIMALDGYEITRRETELTIYEGNVNEQILQRFLMAKIARGCSPRTVKYYRLTVTQALAKIGKTYNEITADDIRMYLAIRTQRDGISKTSANNERRNLSAFYGWLQTEEILLSNPMKKVENIKEEKKRKKAFTQMELEKIRLACKTLRETAIIEILISTWCRVSELSGIRLIDVEGNRVLLHGKGSKEREAFLTPRAQLAISRYLKERKRESIYLISQDVWNNDDGHLSYGHIEGCVRDIGRRAGVQNVHPHRFRRTGATMALQSGMPLITVSKLLGHENIGTTQIYLDISNKDLERAHEKYAG